MSKPVSARDAPVVDAAVAALRRGEVVGLPTETVYGLAGDARNAHAIARVFALKGRPAEHPLIVHLADFQDIEAWAIEVPGAASRLASAFWPGPLTLVLRRHPSVLDAVTGGQPTIAVRVPAHPIAQAILRAFGSGLVAPSANRFGHISPTTAAHVREEFGDAVPIVIDGGASDIGIESSIVDLSGDAPRLLRPGMLAPANIEEVLGRALSRGAAPDSPRVSGSLESHYAPRTPTLWVKSFDDGESGFSRDRNRPHAAEETVGSRPKPRLPGAEGSAAVGEQAINSALVAVLALRDLPRGMRGIALPEKPELYARAMYAALRDLDAGGFGRILVQAPPDTEAWLAIRDRLRRACAGRPLPGKR